MRQCEVRVIKGVTYTTFDYGNAVLVRKARYDYPEDGIAAGDVYVEHLVNGSRETGQRINVEQAIAQGFLQVTR